MIHDTAGLKIASPSLSLVLHDLSLRALLTARSVGGSLSMQLPWQRGDSSNQNTPRTGDGVTARSFSQGGKMNSAVGVTFVIYKRTKGNGWKEATKASSKWSFTNWKPSVISKGLPVILKKHTKYQLTPQGVAEGWDCDSFIRIWRNVHSHSFFKINRQFCVI